MSQGYVIHGWTGGKKKGCTHTPDPNPLVGGLKCRCGAEPLGVIKPERPRRTAQNFNLKGLVLGNVENDPGLDKADMQVFADSLAAFILQLRDQRDKAREQVKLLERECDGLRLALERRGASS